MSWSLSLGNNCSPLTVAAAGARAARSMAAGISLLARRLGGVGREGCYHSPAVVVPSTLLAASWAQAVEKKKVCASTAAASALDDGRR